MSPFRSSVSLELQFATCGKNVYLQCSGDKIDFRVISPEEKQSVARRKQLGCRKSSIQSTSLPGVVGDCECFLLALSQQEADICSPSRGSVLLHKGVVIRPKQRCFNV